MIRVLADIPEVAFFLLCGVVVLGSIAAFARWCWHTKRCTRCRPLRRSRGKCICPSDCGHQACTGDRPTIRAAWTAAELAVLRGEKELEDL